MARVTMSTVTRRSVEMSMRRMGLAARRRGGGRVRARDLHLAAVAQAALADRDDALVALEPFEDLDHGAVREARADRALVSGLVLDDEDGLVRLVLHDRRARDEDRVAPHVVDDVETREHAGL